MESEQTPFLGQFVDLVLQLCTEFDLEYAELCPQLCPHAFLRNHCCSGRQQVLANSIENFISYEKKIYSHCPKYQYY